MSRKHLGEALEAIYAQDLGILEDLRGQWVKACIGDLIGHFETTRDWAIRDMILHLVQDHDDPRLASLWELALDSPSHDTRALAICAVQKDNRLFDAFLVSGFVQADLVDKEIARYRAEKAKQ